MIINSKLKVTQTTDTNKLFYRVYDVDAVTQPITAQGSNYVVYHITEPDITALEEGLTLRVHKSLASSWPKDSGGAVKCIQINDLDPIALFWRYDSFAAWNNFNNVYMTITYTATARASASNYYGYTSQAGFILNFSYDSGNDTYSLTDYGPGKVGSTGLTQYSFTGYDENGNRIPIIQQDGTVGTTPFVYGRGVQYYDGGAKSANTEYGAWSGNFYTRRVNFVVLQALVARWDLKTVDYNTKIYIKGTINGALFTPVGLTATLPTETDGYFYLFLAKSYAKYTATTGNEYWTMDIEHPIYYLDFDGQNGKIVQLGAEVSPRYKRVGGMTVEEVEPWTLRPGDVIEYALDAYTVQTADCDLGDSHEVWLRHIGNASITEYCYYFDWDAQEWICTVSNNVIDLTELRTLRSEPFKSVHNNCPGRQILVESYISGSSPERFLGAFTTTNNSTDTSKTTRSVEYIPQATIKYYAGTEVVNYQEFFDSTKLYDSYNYVDLCYSFNLKNYANLSKGTKVYIRMQEDNWGRLIPVYSSASSTYGNNPLVFDKSTSGNGWYASSLYVFLGTIVSGSIMALSKDHPIYYVLKDLTTYVRLYGGVKETKLAHAYNIGLHMDDLADEFTFLNLLHNGDQVTGYEDEEVYTVIKPSSTELTFRGTSSAEIKEYYYEYDESEGEYYYTGYQSFPIGGGVKIVDLTSL